MKRFLILSLVLNIFHTQAQPTKPLDYGLKQFIIEDKNLGKISFYLDTTGITKKAPLFVDINGSGGLPLCIYVKGIKFSSVVNTFTTEAMEKTKQRYHYVILDKPGTPFCDSITTTQDMKEFNANTVLRDFKYSSEYTKRLSLQWRVQATKMVISYLVKNNYWDKTRIVAYGYSEGGQVVPSLAVEDKRITHVAALVGSGLNQFYDGIIGWRIKAAQGKITQQQAQDSINLQFKIIEDIYKNPTATDKEYGGHSYLRWASFCSVNPFEQLRQLTIPIYMVAGSDDNSSPIYGLDYVPLEFSRSGKTNLTYDVCVGCNHYLVNSTPEKKVSENYLIKILDWVERN
ncbi:MAG: hypothetical protein ABW036_11315 [Flavitalea sp.]